MQGRRLAGPLGVRCIEYALGADLLEPDRINVLEMWTTRSALDDFRGDGPSTI